MAGSAGAGVSAASAAASAGFVSAASAASTFGCTGLYSACQDFGVAQKDTPKMVISIWNMQENNKPLEFGVLYIQTQQFYHFFASK